jgi:DNA-binding PadR family transcriptional regulator
VSPTLFHILVALADQERHGYAIMLDVSARTGGELKLSPGTLYGSIKRMLEDGWIVERDSDDERRRNYRLTALGRKIAEAEASRLETVLRQARATGLLPKRS